MEKVKKKQIQNAAGISYMHNMALLYPADHDPKWTVLLPICIDNRITHSGLLCLEITLISPYMHDPVPQHKVNTSFTFI